MKLAFVMMYVDCKLGRLIETRWASPIDGDDVDHFITRTAAIMRRQAGSFVVFADLEQASVLPPEWIDRVVDLLRSDNARIERNGMLLGNSAVFSMQIERMVRQAGSPARKTFRSLDELKSWILPVLTPKEIARFETFRALPNEGLLDSELPL